MQQGVLTAGLDGREILPGHGAAVHALGEGEALAAPARRDLQHHVAELAVPARLLLVTAAHRHLVADRLAIGDRRLCHFDRDAEARLQTLQRDAQMHFALPEELDLRHAPDRARRRARDLPRRASPSPRRAASRPCDPSPTSASACTGSGARRMGRERRTIRARIGDERVARLRMIEPAEGDHIPFTRSGTFDILAPSRRDRPEMRSSPLAGNDGLRHRRRRRATRGRPKACRHAACESCAGRAPAPARFPPTPRRARVIRDARRLMTQRLQQPRDASAALRRADEQRRDEARAQFLRQIVEDLIARRLDVGNELFHQRVVVIGETLQHGVARFLFRGASRPSGFRRPLTARARGRHRRARARDR